MPRILDQLWLLLAAATDRELTRMVEYLGEGGGRAGAVEDGR